jgi:hypothetical protein
MTLEIQFLAWYMYKHVAELNLLMGFQLSLDNWISNGNTDINKQ